MKENKKKQILFYQKTKKLMKKIKKLMKKIKKSKNLKIKI